MLVTFTSAEIKLIDPVSPKHVAFPVLCPLGRYAMQAMKQMEPQVKQALQSFPTTVRR